MSLTFALKPLCTRTPSLLRTLSDRSAIIYESEYNAGTVSLTLHLHVKGHSPRDLEDFLAHTSTSCRQIGLRIDGRVALPTSVTKISAVKPAHLYSQLEENIELKTHGRILRIAEVPGTMVDVLLDHVSRAVPAGAELTVYDERTDPLDEELLVLLKGKRVGRNVDRWTGINPELHRWLKNMD